LRGAVVLDEHVFSLSHTRLKLLCVLLLADTAASNNHSPYHDCYVSYSEKDRVGSFLLNRAYITDSFSTDKKKFY